MLSIVRPGALRIVVLGLFLLALVPMRAGEEPGPAPVEAGGLVTPSPNAVYLTEG